LNDPEHQTVSRGGAIAPAVQGGNPGRSQASFSNAGWQHSGEHHAGGLRWPLQLPGKGQAFAADWRWPVVLQQAPTSTAVEQRAHLPAIDVALPRSAVNVE